MYPVEIGDLPARSKPFASVFRGARRRRIEAGSVFEPASSPAELHFVERGRVRLFLVSTEGAEKTLYLLPAGSIFGEMAFVEGEADVPYVAVAVEDSVVRSFPIDTVRRQVEADPTLAWALIGCLARKLRTACQHIQDLSFRTVESRVAGLVLACEGSAPTKLTHDDIARFVGSNRVTVTRALRGMRRQGIIDYGRGMKRVSVLDRGRLEAIASREVG